MKGPQDSFKILKDKTWGVPEIFSSYFKNDSHSRSLRFFKITSKTEHKWSLSFFQATSKTKQEVLEILSVYFENKIRNPRGLFKVLQKSNPKGSRDSFKLLQKEDKRSPRFFQATSKIKPKNPRDSFKLLQKQDPHSRSSSLRFFQNTSKTQVVPEILSNYFKKKTHGFREIPSNYFKNNTRDLRDCFELLEK